MRFEAVQPQPGSPEPTDVEACLQEDELTVRHDAQGKPLSVTFRRAP